MQLEQRTWSKQGGWKEASPNRLTESPQIVLVFGDRVSLQEQSVLGGIRDAYPGAFFLGCSTAGEIVGTRVLDDSATATAVYFEHSDVKGVHVLVGSGVDSYDAGAQLAQRLDKGGLRHVFVLSEGLRVNGSDLVRGLAEHLPGDVTVTGGMSGDAGRFERTLVIYNDRVDADFIAAIGLYGTRLKVGFGSQGGWDPFGPERLVTKSSGSVLHELDGQSALDLYKKYLGDHARGLPATGLLFPLSLRAGEDESGVVRTVLAVDENAQSMTFAGDIPEHSHVRFMKANIDRLIDGAESAARISAEAISPDTAELAILISCVGRKMVLGQRVEEEVEAVRAVLGDEAVLTGFYSYGEISPFAPNEKCELHNQTMTITTLSEC
jgi:hypothetical protein